MLKASGLFAPIATPFTDDGHQVSEVRLSRQMRSLLGDGIEGIVVASDSGEFTTCGIAERKSLLELAMRECGGRAEVLVNVSSLSTSVSLDLAQHAGRHGARGAVLMPPFYGPLSEDEVVGFLFSVARHAGIPVVVVDPFSSVTAGVREALAGNPSLVWATPLSEGGYASIAVLGETTATDEFVAGDMVATPLAAMFPKLTRDAMTHGEGVSLKIPATLAAAVGRPRMVKAAFELRNISLGPNRGPVLSLTGGPLQALRAFVDAHTEPQ